MRGRWLLERARRRPNNLAFSEFVALAEAFGFFHVRSRGSHHIYKHRLVPALLNIQDRHGKAKAYQVRQLIALVEEYNLRLEDEL